MVLSGMFSSYDLASAEAQVSVTLKMDRTEATVADTIKLVVKIEGKKGTPAPAISGLESFHVRQGGTSSRFQMINGRISSGIDYVFYLTPRKNGEFVIGPAEVVVKGKKYQSQTVRLKVQSTASESGDRKESLFLTASLSADTGYVGQDHIYVLKFYRARKVSDVSLVLPENDGLSFKKLGDHMEYIASQNGRNYSVIEVRYAVTADKPGSYIITPTFFKMNVLEARDGFYDDSFFGITRAKPLSIASNPVDLNVKPLPEKGRPADFSGLVGKFSLSTALTPQEVKVGASATLTAMVSGKGNARLIPDIKIPDMETVKIYADQPTLDIQTTFEGMAGTKTMKWALVPQRDGSIEIPSMSLSYFDPDMGCYLRNTSEPLTLHVLPGDVSLKAPAQAEKIDIKETVKREVEVQGLDILSIHERPDALRPDSLERLGRWPAAGLLLTPAFLFFLLLGFRHYLRPDRVDERVRAQKKAASKFQRGIESLKGPRQLADMLKITNLYLNERMGLSGGSLTPKEAYDILRDKGVGEIPASEACDILSKLEESLYAGGGETDYVKQLKGALVSVVRKIEKAL